MEFGWHANPIFEHVGRLPLLPRVQFTQSSVHRRQFGWFCCTGVILFDTGGGTAISAAFA